MTDFNECHDHPLPSSEAIPVAADGKGAHPRRHSPPRPLRPKGPISIARRSCALAL